MTARRDFLRRSGAAALGAGLLSGSHAEARTRSGPHPATSSEPRRTALELRGSRRVEYLDMEGGDWVVSPSGKVSRLILSRDEKSGANTKALRTGPGFSVPEKSHFADADHEIFMYEGGFEFDQVHPMRQGDYLYRPAGTVYGNNEQSEAGGIQIISFGRAPRKFHLDDPPDPWPGQYRVDRLWNPEGVPPIFRKSAELTWEPSTMDSGIEEKHLRGQPGEVSECSGASPHSPWAADAAFLLRLPRGYAAPFPSWPSTTLELLALEGRARIGERTWERGSYTFGGELGPCAVEEQLVLYGRSFTDARSAGG